jgi:hypothetical protein
MKPADAARKGGRARANQLSPEELSEQGRKAARVRWEKQPGEPTRDEVLFVRVDAELKTLLRARTKAVQKAHPERTVSEAEVVRSILWEHLKPQP